MICDDYAYEKCGSEIKINFKLKKSRSKMGDFFYL